LSYIVRQNTGIRKTVATTSFTTRIDPALKSRLEQIARLEDRSASYMANQAIRALVEEREATHELLAVGSQLIDKGVAISEATVEAWLHADDEAVFPASDVVEG
jgi:predicted transcriptional regulator